MHRHFYTIPLDTNLSSWDITSCEAVFAAFNIGWSEMEAKSINVLHPFISSEGDWRWLKIYIYFFTWVCSSANPQLPPPPPHLPRVRMPLMLCMVSTLSCVGSSAIGFHMPSNPSLLCFFDILFSLWKSVTASCRTYILIMWINVIFHVEDTIFEHVVF